MKMWYANESDSRKRNGGARAPEGSGEGYGRAAVPGITKSPCTQTHRPRDAPRGGRQSFRSRSPRTAPRSFARPWPGLRPGVADPRRFLPPPQAKPRASRIAPTAQPAAAPQAKFPRRVPSCVLGGGPQHRPAGHPRPTRGELTRPGVFLRSFSCSPRRLSRGVQPGSLHLPVRSPPFFTSPTSPDLVVEGGS